MNATWIMTFLKTLEAEAPPPPGQHHSLTFAQYGSDSEGWSDRLCLGFRKHNGSQNYFLDDNDLKPASDPAACARGFVAVLRGYGDL